MMIYAEMTCFHTAAIVPFNEVRCKARQHDPVATSLCDKGPLVSLAASLLRLLLFFNTKRE